MFESFIVIGIITSLIFNEATDLSPGGLITPGYLALFWDQPEKILSTFLIAVIVCFIVKAGKRILPIFGKRQFALSVTIAVLIKSLISGMYFDFQSFSITISSVGIIVPGLLANDMINQSIRKTTVATGIVTILLIVVLLVTNGQLL